MILRPAFAPHLRVDPLPAIGIQLSGERIVKYLEGEVFIAIADAVRRRLSASEMLASVAGADEREELAQALEHLERSGVLVEAEAGAATAEQVYWSRRSGATQKNAPRYAVASVGAPPPELVVTLGDALQAAGLDAPASDEASAEVVIVLAEDYLHADLAARNARMLQAGTPWLLVRPVGIEPWVGPLFVPGRTGCWECLAQRLRYNRPLHALQTVEQANGYLQVPQGWLPATAGVATRVAATELASYGRSDRASVLGAIKSINTSTWEVETHRLVRLPDCPACGTPPAEKSARIALTPRAIVEGVEGYRARRPEDLLKAFGHHVSSITGVVPYLIPNPRAEKLGLYAYQSGMNSAVVQARGVAKKRGVRHSCGGKGKTEIQAKVGALAEALERYSMRQPHAGEIAQRRLARHDELPRGEVLTPADLMDFTERQYRNRQTINVPGTYNRVPLRWDPRQPLTWTRAWSLRDDAIRYVPAQYCYMYDPSRSVDPDVCVCDSNGVAAGATREDAILQGFFELIERDAVGIWFYNKIARPRVDLDSVNDDYIRQVRGLLDKLGRDLWVVDITHDFGIPVYAAMMRRRDRAPDADVMFGFGAHRDASMAIVRAVSELIQLGVRMLDRDDEDADEAWGPDLTTWLKDATLENQAFLFGRDAPMTRLPFGQKPSSVTEELELCVRACADRGLDFVVHDHTAPDIGLPVVRVIVPKLRHFRQRFAPGRLYEVPVALGWLPRPKTEDELNDLPMPL